MRRAGKSIGFALFATLRRLTGGVAGVGIGVIDLVGGWIVPMNEINNPVIAHLLTRRTVPALQLGKPAPDDARISEMLKAAMRAPDHGKLAPWRFIVFRNGRWDELVDRLMELWRRNNPEASAEAESVERNKHVGGPLVVAVVSTAGQHPKIPEWEQILSAGAVCMNLLHAAHGFGFAAQWLTGWPAYDAEARGILKLAPDERIAGFIHIGTPRESPAERARPDPDELVTDWQG